METESKIEGDIIKYLNLLPSCRAYKTPNKGSRTGKGRKKAPFKGMSDIACCLKGKYIAIEVKKKGGIQSDSQKQFALDIHAAGGEYWLVYSLYDVINKIRAFQ